MQSTLRMSVLFFFTLALAFAFQLRGTDALAQSNYFTSMGCVNCHAAPVMATCNGCHSHGTHPNSAKSTINVAGTTNKSTYAPGETVTVTMTGGYRTGWFRATLFDTDGVTELARSNGNDSGMGNSAMYPATLSHAAPTTPGTYTWVIAWYGNKYDASNGVYGPGWTLDPNNQNTGTANAQHGWEKVNLPPFTVAAAGGGGATAPTITSVTPNSLSQGATNQTVTIAGANLTGATVKFSNAGVTGGTATVGASSITLPVSVSAAAAAGAGTVTVTTTAGSASTPFSVTAATSAGPTLTVSTLANGAYTNNSTLNVSGTATDPAGIKSVTVNGAPVTVGAGGAFSTAVTLNAGANTITVIVTDTNNVTKTDTRTVTYDSTAPVLTITAPADNSTTTSSFATITGSVNESSKVTVSDNSGAPQAASMSGNTFTASVNLVPGVNTISVTATDLAGNSSNAKRSITYTASSLSLAVTYPAADITTSSPSLMLTGTVTDAAGKVTVKVSMNGHTYKPKVRNGAFKQHLNFASKGMMAHKKSVPSVSKQYAITVTATDSTGNTSTVTRNVIYNPPGKGGGNGGGDGEGDGDGHGGGMGGGMGGGTGTGGGTGGATIHPFGGWTDPVKSHPDYVEQNGVTACLSCHSTDPSSKGQPMSCYNCHGKQW